MRNTNINSPVHLFNFLNQPSSFYRKCIVMGWIACTDNQTCFLMYLFNFDVEHRCCGCEDMMCWTEPASQSRSDNNLPALPTTHTQHHTSTHTHTSPH